MNLLSSITHTTNYSEHIISLGQNETQLLLTFPISYQTPGYSNDAIIILLTVKPAYAFIARISLEQNLTLDLLSKFPNVFIHSDTEISDRKSVV